MTLIKLCGLALLAAFLLFSLREAGGRALPLIGLGGGLFLLFHLLERYSTLFAFLGELPGGELYTSLLSLSLRVLGVALLTEVTAGICRDLGEAGLATRLEWCGRAEILVLALPTLHRLLELAVGLFSE